MRGLAGCTGCRGSLQHIGSRVWRDVASFPTPGAGVGGAYRSRPRRRDFSRRLEARVDFAAIHLARSRRDARRLADDARALLAQGGARVRRTPRRMDRRAAGATAQAGRVRAGRRDAFARRRSHDRPPSWRARRRMDRDGRARSLASASPASPPMFRAASPIFSNARRARISRPRSPATPSGWTSSRAASCCATRRADGARAHRPAGSISPGGSFWRRRSCSTISPRTRSRISCT